MSAKARTLALALLLGGTALEAQLAPAPPSSPGQGSTLLGGPGPTSSSAPPTAGQGLLAPAPPAVRGRYLDATPSVIHDTARGRLTLIVDVAPKPGMRVYAPGNAGYTPVALSVDVPAGMTLLATTYPRAEDYLFAPLNERVKVYTAPFRLERAIRVGSSRAAGRAPSVLTGRLEYQACDDKVCYLPQTLSLSWSLAK